MRFKLARSLGTAFGTVALVAACGSIPDVTFEDVDGAAPGDASVGPDGRTNGGSTSKDGSAWWQKDSGTQNGGKDSGDNQCGAGSGEICCGTEICRGCTQSDCSKCQGLGCNKGEVCCSKGQNLTCHSPQGC